MNFNGVASVILAALIFFTTTVAEPDPQITSHFQQAGFVVLL